MEKEHHQITTSELRDTLKQIVSDELSKLPELLEKMNEDQRISFVLKVMPYVFPKVNNVHILQGEADEYEIKPFTCH